ncbi:MAG: hypothetical protein AAF741_07975 [Bacteroidota bacterium]
MKILTTALLSLLLAFSVQAQLDGPVGALVNGNAIQEQYNTAKILQLQEAYQAMRAGQWILSEQRYEATLVNNPDWVPGLVGMANLMNRTGRATEARQYLDRAIRVDAVAAEFLMLNNPADLIRFIALYPSNVDMEVLSRLPQVGTQPDELRVSTAASGTFINNANNNDDIDQFNYFEPGMLAINDLPEDDIYYQTLKLFVNSDMIGAKRLLRSPTDTYADEPSLYSFTLGNLAMLNGQYVMAMDHYDRTKLRLSQDWPEAQYNRGLAKIKVNVYDQGCRFLQQAAAQDYLPAEHMLKSLCSF